MADYVVHVADEDDFSGRHYQVQAENPRLAIAEAFKFWAADLEIDPDDEAERLSFEQNINNVFPGKIGMAVDSQEWRR